MNRLAKKNVLVTGVPGVGKTTLVEKVLKELSSIGVRWRGFFTREIREKGARVGFEIVTHTGERGILAHVNFVSGPRVGRYRVNLASLEKIAVPSISPHGAQIIVIDEIGTMEMFSPLFVKALERVFSSQVPVLATIKKKPDKNIDRFKHRDDVELFEVTLENREEIFREVLNLVKVLVRRIK